MRKVVKPKITYVYVEPKTPEEKAEQERRLAHVYDMIFDQAIKNLRERKKQTSLSAPENFGKLLADNLNRNLKKK